MTVEDRLVHSKRLRGVERVALTSAEPAAVVLGAREESAEAKREREERERDRLALVVGYRGVSEE